MIKNHAVHEKTLDLMIIKVINKFSQRINGNRKRELRNGWITMTPKKGTVAYATGSAL
jgi:hypothetical protein